MRVFFKTRAVLFRAPTSLVNKHNFVVVINRTPGYQSQSDMGSNIPQQFCEVACHLKYVLLSEGCFKWRICVLQPYHHHPLFFFPRFLPTLLLLLLLLYSLLPLILLNSFIPCSSQYLWIVVCGLVPFACYLFLHFYTLAQMNIMLRLSSE